MNFLLEKEIIKKMECGSNFAYILEDNTTFLSTEYKVLQSQDNGCFLKCMKMQFNGKTELFYLTGSLKPFASMIPSLDSNSFLTIVGNIFKDIMAVKNNGFLSCNNIDISFESIFVDPNTYKVSLVYLPLNQHIYEDTSAFENELRTSLVKLISGISTLSNAKTMQLSADLQNGSLNIENIYSRLGGKVSEPQKEPRKEVDNVNPGRSDTIKLVAMNAPYRVEVLVNKDEFIIGKKESEVDGVVSFNKMISRVHCKITKINGVFYISDLQSANGTYVNKMRLQPNVPQQIKAGDVIRMADSDFQVI